MTKGDLPWRAAGFAISMAGCIAHFLDRSGSPRTIVYFLITLIGVALLLNGRRIAILWRAERRGHQNTASTVRFAHARRRRRPLDRGDV